MKLCYADGKGVVHAYAVAWWKVTTPTKGVWAYAAQSRPSLTLQTCLGSRSQYRLIVRLEPGRLTDGASGALRRPAARGSCRAITSRWIWLVPSPISVSFASRMKRSTG